MQPDRASRCFRAIFPQSESLSTHQPSIQQAHFLDQAAYTTGHCRPGHMFAIAIAAVWGRATPGVTVATEGTVDLATGKPPPVAAAGASGTYLVSEALTATRMVSADMPCVLLAWLALRLFSPLWRTAESSVASSGAEWSNPRDVVDSHPRCVVSVPAGG